MKKIVTIGEVMLRLSPPGNQRFFQANHLELEFGGSEANVAAALA
jgi:2-dehydro-3-deoxygluconokinase